MKYIKTYKLFENINSDLISKLEEFKIENYIINNNGTVDGDVSLYNKLLTKIPLNFGKVNNHFICSNNRLESLEHCPSEIGWDFYCNNNYLTMLDCSSYIKGNIICRGMFTKEPEFFGDCEGKIYW